MVLGGGNSRYTPGFHYRRDLDLYLRSPGFFFLRFAAAILEFKSVATRDPYSNRRTYTTFFPGPGSGKDPFLGDCFLFTSDGVDYPFAAFPEGPPRLYLYYFCLGELLIPLWNHLAGKGF